MYPLHGSPLSFSNCEQRKVCEQHFFSPNHDGMKAEVTGRRVSPWAMMKRAEQEPLFHINWELMGHCGVQGWELVWGFPMVTATMEIIFFSGAFKDLEPGFNHSLKENKGRTWTGIALFFWRCKRFPTGVLGGWAQAPKAAAMSKDFISKWPSREQGEPSWPWGKLSLDPGRNRLIFSKCQSNHVTSFLCKICSVTPHWS